MLDACVFFLAEVFKVRTSAAVHVRRFDFFGHLNISVLAKRTETLVAEARGKENKNLAEKKLAAAAAFSLYSPTLRMMLLIAPGSWRALEACPASRFGLEIRLRLTALSAAIRSHW